MSTDILRMVLIELCEQLDCAETIANKIDLIESILDFGDIGRIFLKDLIWNGGKATIKVGTYSTLDYVLKKINYELLALISLMYCSRRYLERVPELKKLMSIGHMDEQEMATTLEHFCSRPDCPEWMKALIDRLLNNL